MYLATAFGKQALCALRQERCHALQYLLWASGFEQVIELRQIFSSRSTFERVTPRQKQYLRGWLKRPSAPRNLDTAHPWHHQIEQQIEPLLLDCCHGCFTARRCDNRVAALCNSKSSVRRIASSSSTTKMREDWCSMITPPFRTLRLSLVGQYNTEDAPLAHLTLDLDLAAVLGDDMRTDRQP